VAAALTGPGHLARENAGAYTRHARNVKDVQHVSIYMEWGVGQGTSVTGADAAMC
jgi:hypothetical protein